MKHVVNFSGGYCSFWAAHRVIAKYGPENVTLLFADVLIESPDLYEFNSKASEILGVPITRVSREITPWQLFRMEGLIGNNRSPICSIRLKREVLDDWFMLNCLEFCTTIYIGFEWTELPRLQAIRQAKPFWHIEAPMTEEPIWDKCKMIQEGERLGLKTPEAYRQGFTHNNCGKRCVRAGISHFVHLYHVDRPSYLEWEEEEQQTLAVFNARGVSSAGWTILRDRRGGQAKPLSLRDLRLRIERGEELPKYEWGGCGCGSEYDKAA